MKLADLRPFDVINHLRDEEDVLWATCKRWWKKTTPKRRRRPCMTLPAPGGGCTSPPPLTPADYLKDEAHTTAYLQMAAEEAAENGDNSILLDAIQTAAKAYGMTDLAKATGIPRESLYRSLREGNSPRYDTVSKILNALGMTITLTPRRTAPD